MTKIVKRKIIKYSFILLIISSCSKEFQETALLTPPNLNQMPVIENDNIEKRDSNNISTEDIADVKKLLLQ
jgi:hypothetical protein